MRLSCAFSRRAAVPATALRAQRVALGAQVLDLALGVERVPDPAGQVAEGLERAARALLDRRHDVEHPALHGVQPAAGLAEVGGQEDQGAGDEQPEDCPPPADRLVVHVAKYSKVV